MIRWQTYPDKGAPRDVLVEWSVLAEHEDDFADLRAAFVAAGQTIPVGTVAPEGMTP